MFRRNEVSPNVHALHFHGQFSAIDCPVLPVYPREIAGGPELPACFLAGQPLFRRSGGQDRLNCGRVHQRVMDQAGFDGSQNTLPVVRLKLRDRDLDTK